MTHEAVNTTVQPVAESAPVVPQKPRKHAELRMTDALRRLLSNMGAPLVSFAIFLFAWSQIAEHVKVNFGSIPGPLAVWHQGVILWDEHWAERAKE
ncbi:MAG: hypothetical protein KGR98_11475, partial [Verrucomicrobia bacterium]|nr:hypothetical protein [Verrucomicrobiota bacterium]